MQLKKGTIHNLQNHITGKIKEWGFEDESLHERLLLLTEELGELVHASRKVSGMNVDQNREIKNNPGEELVDMLNLLFAVAAKLDIDLEKEYVKKEAIVDKRTYKRTQ